ncbi:MAG: hypothetical protein LBT27_04925 [Prevotellaceae bacterium]|jgi:hypothetical protein|nr:hypothetical protein [Prevotellaceae bacterium]
MAYNDFIPIGDTQSELEKEILDIIEVNSFSKNILAAYKARRIANKLSKEKYRKANYKEYVEMLMVKYFPNELAKSKLGTKYARWKHLVISLFFLIPFSVPVLLLIVLPTRKKLKELYQN